MKKLIRDVLDYIFHIETWKRAGIVLTLMTCTSVMSTIFIILFIIYQDRGYFYEVLREQYLANQSLQRQLDLSDVFEAESSVTNVTVLLQSRLNTKIQVYSESKVFDRFECFTDSTGPSAITICPIHNSTSVGHVRIDWLSNYSPSEAEILKLYTTLQHIIGE